MNEFDLTGAQFLALYVPVTLGTIFGAIAIRYGLKITTSGEHKDIELSAYEAAYLSGGDKRVVDAAAAKLFASDILTASNSRAMITIKNELPNNAEPVERAVFQAARNHTINYVADLYRYVTPIPNSIRGKLIEAGLILSDAKTLAIRVICSLMVLGPIEVLGVPKILFGLERHKPVGFLSLLCLVGLAAAVYFIRQSCVRTARGDAAVAYLQQENRALEYSVKYGDGGSSNELAMATGLFGTAILLTSPLLASMRPAFAGPVRTSGSSCSSGVSGCGSSCGGGGCGGGCGGCGG